MEEVINNNLDVMILSDVEVGEEVPDDQVVAGVHKVGERHPHQLELKLVNISVLVFLLEIQRTHILHPEKETFKTSCSFFIIFFVSLVAFRQVYSIFPIIKKKLNLKKRKKIR